MAEFKSINDLFKTLANEFEELELLGSFNSASKQIQWHLNGDSSWNVVEIESYISNSLIPNDATKGYYNIGSTAYLLIQQIQESTWLIIASRSNIYPQLNMFFRGMSVELEKGVEEVEKLDLPEPDNQPKSTPNPFTEKLQAAKRLQSTLLPKEERLNVILNKYWVHYEPQDIIGGDIYWVKEFEDVNYLIIADCTGHSVEGALATMTVYSIMNECLDPDSGLKENLDTFFSKINQYNDAEDAYGIGVEVALVRIDKKEPIVSFISTGIFVMTQFQNEWELHKVRKSMDPESGPTDKALIMDNLTIGEGDKIVLFSDGLPDQFDKSNKKRLGSKGMKNIIMDIGENGSFNQEGLKNKVKEWQGETEQVDDITVFALEF